MTSSASLDDSPASAPHAPDSPDAPDHPGGRSRRATGLRVTSGNFHEQFDFFLFGV